MDIDASQCSVWDLKKKITEENSRLFLACAASQMTLYLAKEKQEPKNTLEEGWMQQDDKLDTLLQNEDMCHN